MASSQLTIATAFMLISLFSFSAHASVLPHNIPSEDIFKTALAPRVTQGLNAELCQTDAECAGTRFCGQLDGFQVVECDSTADFCFCHNANEEELSCGCDDPSCPDGEVCVQLGPDISVGTQCASEQFVESNMGAVFQPLTCDDTTDTPGTQGPDETPVPQGSDEPTATSAPETPSNPPVATSPSQSPSAAPDATSPPEPETAAASPEAQETEEATVSEEVCIDAEALGEFDVEDLVYESHPLSRVLCDTSGSCATKGHIVHYNGVPMMMQTYCKTVGCVQHVKRVNSPKYRRGIRVSSKTEGLTFTAFAARYATRAEEAILTTASRMGM